MRKTPEWIDYRQFEEYYNLGYTDRVIAGNVGCTTNSVIKWRQRTGKKANKAGISTGSTARLPPHGDYYNICLKKFHVDKLGWEPEDLLQISLNNDMIIIRRLPKREIQHKVCIDKEKAQELYDLGKTDAEIADELKINSCSVSGWRYRRNLKANTTKKCIDKEKAQRLYSLGYTDKMLSDELNISVRNIKAWRKRNNLKLGAARVKWG